MGEQKSGSLPESGHRRRSEDHPVDVADADHVQERGGQRNYVPKEGKLTLCELEDRPIVPQVCTDVPILQELSASKTMVRMWGEKKDGT